MVSMVTYVCVPMGGMTKTAMYLWMSVPATLARMEPPAKTASRNMFVLVPMALRVSFVQKKWMNAKAIPARMVATALTRRADTPAHVHQATQVSAL